AGVGPVVELGPRVGRHVQEDLRQVAPVQRVGQPDLFGRGKVAKHLGTPLGWQRGENPPDVGAFKLGDAGGDVRRVRVLEQITKARDVAQREQLTYAGCE